MSARLPLVFTLVLAAFAGPASAQLLPCVSQVTDPCVLNTSTVLPVGTYDIRPKSLLVANRELTITGAGDLRILANNITFQPGARFIATGTDGNTRVFLDATGTLELQSAGTSKSKIDVSGNFGGGTIDLKSVGNMTINGTLIANAANVLGFGGTINLLSTTGNVTVTGDPSEGIKSFGNAQGSGGTIALTATLGSIAVSTQLVPKGGDCGGCTIDLIAGTDITSTAQGLMDMRASGVGDGGFFSAVAGNNINLAGNILANGSSDDLDGGGGGEVFISAGGSVVVGGRIELNGAGRYDTGVTGFSVDGSGGSSDISAGTTITMNGPMFGIAKGYGDGDEFEFEAIGNITFNGEIDMTADVFPGSISAFTDSLITVNARLRTQATVDPLLDPSVLGGSIDLEACQINVTNLGEVIALGAGGIPSGTAFLTASTGLSIAGKLQSTEPSELTYRTSPPVITGTATPPPHITQSSLLPCCGVQCTTTTTSTTTTSSTSSSTSSTTSSSSSTTPPTTGVPTTTTSSTAPPSTVVPTTTTSSSAPPSTVLPTTSSTSLAPTTTSTSLAPTTTSTSLAPTSTSTSLAASTTTTSSLAPTTTSLAPTTTSTSLAPSTTSSTSLASTTTSLAPTTSSTSLASTTTSLAPTTSSTSLASTTTSLAPTTSSTSLASTTSTAPTTSTTGASTTSTIATTTSSTSTLPTTTTSSSTVPTTTSSSSTLAPPTTIVVVTTTSSTSPPTPTTSTTLPPPDCADTSVGADVVRCLLDEINDVFLSASQDDLGGKRLARLLTRFLDKATSLAEEPTANKRLRKAGKQLKLISSKLNKALAKGKADAALVNEITALAGEAQSIIAGLIQ